MKQFSYKLASKFYDAEIISHDAIDDYAYAIETLLVKAIGWIVLLSVAFIIGWFKELFCYLLFFSAVRAYGGGFHTKSLMGCLILSVASLFIPIMLYKTIYPFLGNCQGGLIVLIIFDILVGSVNNEYIDWDQKELIKAKRNNRIIVCAEVAILLISYLIHIDSVYIVFMSLGLTAASLSMLVELIIQKGGRNHEKQ